MLDKIQTGLLKDILESARAIRAYLSGVDHDQFLKNMEKQDAVLRRFEIIGEAASRLSAETIAMFPNLPFKAMKGMRNVIIHDYGDIDLEQVWKTASEDLDELVTTLERHLA